MYVYIDFDSYFANLEILKNPTLKHKPIGVGQDSRRGVLSTCNYLARQFGVYSGCPAFKAKKLCPNIVILKSDIKFYQEISDKIFWYFKRNYSTKLKVNSIDECVLDIRQYLKKTNLSLDQIGNKIRKEVQQKFNITCSIGISDSIPLAKIGTEINKPNGQYILFKKDVKEKLWPLSIGLIYGVGIKTREKLNEFGIKTIYDFINYKDKEKLEKTLGSAKYYDITTRARGEGKIFDDIDAVVENKSISKDVTFDNNLSFSLALDQYLDKLCQIVSLRLKQESLKGNIINIGIKYEKFKRYNKQLKIAEYIDDKETIKSYSYLLLEQLMLEKELNSIKFLSIGLSNLKNKRHSYEQLTINNYQFTTKSSKTPIQNINNKFGKRVLFTADELETSSLNRSNSPTERTDIKLKVWNKIEE